MSTAARDSTDRFVGGLEHFSSEYFANETINAGDAVKLNGNNQVVQSDTDGEAFVGVAMFDAARGEAVTIAKVGAQVRVNATNTLRAGDLVTSHGGTSAGRVDTGDATGDVICGYCDVGGSSNEAVITITGPGGDNN